MVSGTWSPDRLRWEIAEPFAAAEATARQLHVHPLIAQVLHNRGLDDPEAAGRFLDPKLTDLHDPELLGGAADAARRIARAAASGRKIVIYGDYDVDGITGTAILHTILRMVSAQVDYYVPHRLDEGYGLNADAVDKLISDGAELMVTVDCGISAVGPVARAMEGGLEVIITDHHNPGAEFPSASATVHPSIPGDQYPNTDLSGSGVAFKLAWQIAREICGSARVDDEMRRFLLDATCLAALGTIADVVPLLGENRVLATYGLLGLAGTEHVGLRALLASSGLEGKKLDAHHVGFVLGPRLNAAGRMGHARLAVEMLTGASADRSRQIARYLEQQNTERRKVQDEITRQAVEIVESQGLDAPDRRAIVVGSENWHGGVIGIVASHLVGRFGRPAIVVSFSGDDGQGSGRSIDGFDMYEALAACGKSLRDFGGHAMAGGLRIDRGKFDTFAEEFVHCASSRISDEQLTPPLQIDAEASLEDLSYDVVRGLSQMAPFGRGNPAPVVAVKACRVLVPPRRIGRSGTTVAMTLGQETSSMRAVGFGMGDLADMLTGINQVDIACEPKLNTFNGRTSVEVMLRDVRWD